MTSPALTTAAASTRTENETRLAHVRALWRTMREATDTSYAEHRKRPEPFDHDNEDHIRWHIKKERLIGAVVKARLEFEREINAYFKWLEETEKCTT